ncbi:IclR family transcriptional regulator [Pseudorhodoferax sp.]|uniref:IclR family transcriptional regulator n=1 Tax=Pseudorhodoferax sp. TaxID=1993553 RepID=UPI002DD6ACD1|nr:IclR family transcriptional regulator C-terminal domain-containing protein [Pseudorhodoferax sp.]
MPSAPSTPAAAEPRSGTQSVQRAVFLLREIASRGPMGWGLRDLARHCALDPGTVHRLLKCLVDERLVAQRASDRRYVIGPLNFELGLGVPNRLDLMETVPGVLRRLARAVPKASTVCFLRGEDDCICLARAGQVHYTGATTLTRVGQRVALLALAGGIAIIAALPAQQAAPVLERNRRRIAAFGTAHLARVDEILRATRRDGYAVSEGTLWHGVNSVSLVFGPRGAPLGAVSVSSAADHHSAAALRDALPALREAVDALTERAG